MNHTIRSTALREEQAIRLRRTKKDMEDIIMHILWYTHRGVSRIHLKLLIVMGLARILYPALIRAPIYRRLMEYQWGRMVGLIGRGRVSLLSNRLHCEYILIQLDSSIHSPKFNKLINIWN